MRTAVIGVGHLGKQHARIHAELAAAGRSQLVGVCDIDAARRNAVEHQCRTFWGRLGLDSQIRVASVAVGGHP